MQENHKRFADKYFETLNASQSAIFAGFSEKTAKEGGHQVLKRDDVQKYLQLLRDEYAEKSGISKQWIIDRFKHISDTCTYDLDKIDSSGANKATEMLGKIIGVFEKDNEQSRQNITVSVSKEEAKEISNSLDDKY